MMAVLNGKRQVEDKEQREKKSENSLMGEAMEQHPFFKYLYLHGVGGPLIGVRLATFDDSPI